MTSKLSINDVARGLQRFSPDFDALDVFADDIAELQAINDGRVPDGLRPISNSEFEVTVDNQPYVLSVFREAGVARLRKGTGPGLSMVGGALVGGFTGAAILAATTKKEEAAVGGLLLGMLVGALLGKAGATPVQPQRVLTLRFDELQRVWRAYGGSLVPWMKDKLATS